MRLPIAAGTAPPFLFELAVLLVAGAVIAYVGYRLGLVPIVGFLLTGVLIGPNALGLVHNQALIDQAAEVGVILLLFTIGIEFSLEKLARIQRLIFGGGGLQVALTSSLTLLVLLALGVPWQAGLFTGFLVALSSTAIVLKLLGDRGETGSTVGQISLGLLVFQDLAVIGMVLLVPMLAGAGGTAADIAWALLRAAFVIALVLIVARRVMPPLLERVARTCSQELFLLSLIAICFGTAYLTSLAGVSVALGAFLAGLVVSESRFAAHAFGEIMPLQILFAATFFVSVGMLLDLGFLATHLPLVLGVVGAVLVLKVVTTGASVLALGYPLPAAVASSLMLAQVGEFSFVLERTAREFGLFPAGLEVEGSQAFIAATVVLMVLTPPLSQLGARLQRRVEMPTPPSRDAEKAPLPDPAEPVDLENHIVVADYGRTARRLVHALRQAGLPHVVLTLSPGRAQEAEREGSPVLRGDATRAHTLQHARIDRARVLVIPEYDPERALRIVMVARPLQPDLTIVTRVRYPSEVRTLVEAGVTAVVTEELEHVVGLFGEVARRYDDAATSRLPLTDALRADDVRVLFEPVTAAEASADAGGSRRLQPAGLDGHTPAPVRPRLYGTGWCPLTGGFRAYFRQHAIPFDYFDVEEDVEAEAAVRAMNDGRLKFPMIVVGDETLKNPPIAELEAALRAYELLD